MSRPTLAAFGLEVVHSAAPAIRRAAPADPLQARAEKLWPDSPRNQQEWLRAVKVVRSTTRGWLADRKVRRL